METHVLMVDSLVMVSISQLLVLVICSLIGDFTAAQQTGLGLIAQGDLAYGEVGCCL